MECSVRFISGLPQPPTRWNCRAKLIRTSRIPEQERRYMADRYAAFAELVHDRLAVIDSSALRHRREPSSDDRAPSRHLRLAAVQAQAALAQQDHGAAQLAVTSMVNQMISLAGSAPWWRSDAEAAMADTVDWSCGNHEISSAPAQQAWDRYRAAKAAFAAVGEELPNLPPDEYEALTRPMNQAEEEWLAAWNDWHAVRQARDPGEA